jgi:hypothetical protein
MVIEVSSNPKLFWELWGIWLYTGLAARAMILEVLTVRASEGSSQDG